MSGPAGFFVLVSGRAGSGKTTLARGLSPALGIPLLSKDMIKEALADSLGLGDDAWSQRLGGASFEVMWALAAHTPAAVLETSWHRERARPRLEALGKPVVEVHCTCPDAVLRRRLEWRAGTDRHPIHREVITPRLIDDIVDLAPAGDVLGLGPVLDVDTSQPVDARAVAEWVHRRVASPAR